MKEKMLKAIRILPGEQPELIQIENKLEALQQAVDGYIEVVTLEGPGLVVVVNEEGRLRGMLPAGVLNIGRLVGQLLAGPVLVLRSREDEFASVRNRDLELVRFCWNPAL